jgi:hypothetical protein
MRAEGGQSGNGPTPGWAIQSRGAYPGLVTGVSDKAFAAYVGQRLGEVPGVLACTAHAVLAARGEWITNEKRLIDRAGLRHADALLLGLRAAPESLIYALDEAQALIAAAVAPFGLPGP